MGRKTKSIAKRKGALVSSRLEVTAFKRLEEIAESLDRPVSQVVRIAINEYIARHGSGNEVAA